MNGKLQQNSFLKL